MIPLSADRVGTFPLFTGLSLVAMIAGYLGLTDGASFYGFVPVRTWSVQTWSLLGPFEQVFPFVSYPFLHGSPLHFGSNLWGLWVFGSALERRQGKMAYVSVWLLSGVTGGLAYMMGWPETVSPLIGASACVAGIIGALCVQARSHAVKTLVFWKPLTPIYLNIWIFVGCWATLSLFAFLTTGDPNLMAAGTVHFSGFLAGCILGFIFRKYGQKMNENWIDLPLNDEPKTRVES